MVFDAILTGKAVQCLYENPMTNYFFHISIHSSINLVDLVCGNYGQIYGKFEELTKHLLAKPHPSNHS